MERLDHGPSSRRYSKNETPGNSGVSFGFCSIQPGMDAVSIERGSPERTLDESPRSVLENGVVFWFVLTFGIIELKASVVLRL